MFKNSFSFKGRIRRTEYAISIIICTGIILITNALALSLKGPVPVFIIYIPLLWFLWAQGAKRCHDIGNTGWYQIIPFYVFWMLFTESHKGINEYGINPKGNGNQEQNIIVTKKEQYASETTSQTPSQYKRFDLPAEQSNFLATIKRKWGNGTEFFAGDAFSLISEEYLNWYTKEAESKNVLCFNHRESATLELLEKFRIQGLLTKRVDDDKWYYLFSNTLPVTESSNSKLCKAYKNGRCISKTGSDSGPCSWKPVDWKNCGVVVESEKLYGLW